MLTVIVLKWQDIVLCLYTHVYTNNNYNIVIPEASIYEHTQQKMMTSLTTQMLVNVVC